jgi:hypothetical protein
MRVLKEFSPFTHPELRKLKLLDKAMLAVLSCTTYATESVSQDGFVTGVEDFNKTNSKSFYTKKQLTKVFSGELFFCQEWIKVNF